MNQVEKTQVKENIELSSEHQQRIAEAKKNIYQVARTLVVEEKATNEERNAQLKDRLLALQQELAALRKHRNDILGKRKELRINISINEEELEEYRAVGSLQKAKIKAHKDKIDQLKVCIAEEVAKREGRTH
jgi:chromosome segregation ATPase